MKFDIMAIYTFHSLSINLVSLLLLRPSYLELSKYQPCFNY